jgi:hypothetical protein
MILRALPLADCPATVWNLCRPEVFSVREVATRIGKRFGRIPRFAGQETETALLANPAKICERLGRPPTDLETMLGWIADWIEAGGPDLGKPTQFETRDGNY